MSYEIYEVLVVSGATVLALLLVRYRDQQKKKARVSQSMRRMLATVCK